MTESSMQYPGNSNTRCRFIVGRNLDGCWVVCDRQRLVGGLFADRESAIHFAVSESEHEAGAVWCAEDGDCLIADPWTDLSVHVTPFDDSSHRQGRYRRSA